ncbi:MAG TPA: FG-GAP repeat protein [Rhodanobacteraceae bacterium]|nr:FG-GAP repeat protein [Rhodanobacteraceae bacterium]
MKERVRPDRLRLRATALAGALALAFALPAGAVESAIIVSPTASTGAEMAYGVGVDGTTLAVGAPGENDVAGAAYVVDCSALPCGAPLRIAPAELVAGDAFGTALGISGNTLVVVAAGAPGDAYVFVGDGVGFSQQAKLTPSGIAPGERFGQSVALSGDRVAIGAGRIGVNGAGAVYVFVRTGTTWTQEAKLTPSDGAPFDAFGTSVALDADTILVGAPMKAASAAGAYANGAAYAFVRGAGGWSEQAKLTAAGANGDLFGYAVGLAGDRAVIGAPYSNNAQGQAYVFARSGTTWSQQAVLTTAAGAAGDELGWSVAVGDDSLFVGAPFAGQLNGVACGASYVFDSATLGEAGGTTIMAPVGDELAGWSVAASGVRWVTSAPGHVVGDIIHAGAAYWFDPAITIFHSGFDAPGACIAPENVSPQIAR